MSSANSRYLAPKVPGGLMMSTGKEFTPTEELILQQLADLSYSIGDILYWNGTQLTNLGIGSSGKVLTVSGGIPSWQPASSGTWYQDEVPSGTKNGSNTTFTLAHTPTAVVLLHLNGVYQVSGIDYNRTGTTITMTVAPLSTDILICTYS